jgi:hypothetical protein
MERVDWLGGGFEFGLGETPAGHGDHTAPPPGRRAVTADELDRGQARASGPAEGAGHSPHDLLASGAAPAGPGAVQAGRRAR